MRQSGFFINKSVVMAAVIETAFNVVFPVQQTAFAPNLATSVVVLTPKMATSDSAEAATNAPPRTAVGVTTLRSKMEMVRTSSLSTKGGRKGAMMSINASRAIVPYLMIWSLMVSSMGDCIICLSIQNILADLEHNQIQISLTTIKTQSILEFHLNPSYMLFLCDRLLCDIDQNLGILSRTYNVSYLSGVTVSLALPMQAYLCGWKILIISSQLNMIMKPGTAKRNHPTLIQRLTKTAGVLYCWFMSSSQLTWSAAILRTKVSQAALLPRQQNLSDWQVLRVQGVNLLRQPQQACLEAKR